MTQKEFTELPMLLLESQATKVTGYAPATLDKLVDCQVLRFVKPAGAGHGRLQKVQLAVLIGLGPWIEEERQQWREEAMLLAEKAVTRWTGYAGATLAKIVEAGGLVKVTLPGTGAGRFRKQEVGEWIGLE